MIKFTSWKRYAKYIISASLLAFLLTKVDFDNLLQRSQDINILLVFFAFAFIISQIFLLSLRWHGYLNAERGAHVPFKISILINIAGYFANILFIASVGGVIVKTGLAVKQGLSITRAVFASFLDRFMTFASLIIFSALALPFLQNIVGGEIFAVLVLVVVGVFLAVILLVITLRLGALKKFIIASRRISRIAVVFRSYIGNKTLMFSTLIYSLLAQACFILSVYILSLGVESEVDVVAFLAIMPILALISALPISFGGWGVREGAFVYGLGLIGFSMESAFFLSVQVGVITLIAPFFVGLPYLFKSDLRDFIASGGACNKSSDNY